MQTLHRIQNGAKPEILFLGSQMETGGAQRVLLAQADWFHKNGYSVVAAFLYDKENLRERWAQQYDFPIVDLHARIQNDGKVKNVFHLLGGIYRLVKLFSKHEFSVIETFTHHSNLIGLPLAAAAGVPVRIATHHGRINRFPHWLESLHTRLINSKMTTRLVVVSDGVYRAAVEEGIRPQKIITIFNGVSIPEVEGNARKDVRAELGLPLDTPLVMSVGRLSYEKGHIFLIRAAPAVIDKFPDAQIVVVGDGLLRLELEEEAEKLGISENVFFLGIRTDVPRLLETADIFVLPSRSEGLSIALLEALGMSIPVIATDVGGSGQVVIDHDTGILIPPEDSSILAESINELLEDECKRAQFAAAGKELVMSNYSIEKMCLEYQKIFTRTEEDIS